VVKPESYTTLWDTIFDLAKNGFPVDAFDAGCVTTLRSQCT